MTFLQSAAIRIFRTLSAPGDPKARLAILSLIFIPIIVLTRAYGMDIVSGDYTSYLEKWVRVLHDKGAAEAYGLKFSNYAPLYTYLLGLSAALLPWIPALFTIKLYSFAGEILAAVFMFRIVALHRKDGPVIPLLAAYTLLILPSLILNSTVLTQCDILWSSCLLGCLYHAMRKNSLGTMIWFGLAISFKLQAVFLGPFLAILFLWGDLSPRHLLIPAGIYILTALPCLAAGRGIQDVMTIYLAQADVFKELSFNAPNIYYFIPNEHYESLKWGGLAFAGMIMSAFAAISARKISPHIREHYALLALISVAFMPFLIPKMHERYFFAADVFSLLLAFLNPAWRHYAILFQVVSCLAILPLVDGAGWSWLVTVAAIINIFVMMSLYRIWHRSVFSAPQHETGEK